MTTCRCGAETTKLHQTWEAGQVVDEYCPTCRPEAFERVQAPSEKKLWLGWEYDPRYTKSRDPDGQTRMTPSDSVLQDLQDAATKPPDGEVQSRAEAIERKRRNRRLTEMDPTELSQALHVARALADSLEAGHAL